MSADNGIYILKTKDQFRVIHAQAIENVFWSYVENRMMDEFVSTRLVEYFNTPRYTRDESKAFLVANAMAKNCTMLEYGIQTLPTHKSWNRIVKEAKEYAKLEIEAIIKRGRAYQMSDVPNLERIINM